MDHAAHRYHQEISAVLSGEINVQFREHKYRFFSAPFDVKLSTTDGKDTVVQPAFASFAMKLSSPNKVVQSL